ncbi:MAG: hypothetical protein ABJN40_04490 [Sneathiella sp.]
MSSFMSQAWTVFRESILVYWRLLKIMVPVMVIVEIAIRFGVVTLISEWCEPFMTFVGLPAELAIVLATNLLVGIYGAGAALVTLGPGLELTVANMTVLGGMMLFAHAIPIEQTIVKKTGVSFTFSTLTRLTAMMFYGWLLHWIYSGLDVLQAPATILITSDGDSGDGSWISWVISSAIGLFWIFWILLFLVSLLRILEVIGFTRLMTKALTPTLRFIGVGPNAAPLTMIGILLGLSFGGALILREVEKGVLKPKSIFISMIFMGLCHSIIEDTLVVMAFGGHWSGVLVGRILLSILLILPVSFIILKLPDSLFERFLFKSRKGPNTA